MKHTHITYAFSIIEVLIGIFIFSLGLVSIYALIVSSLTINDRNKNSIIASHLAREQIELFRNIRDTNYKNLKVWNQRNPSQSWLGAVFEIDKYYKLENNFSVGSTTSVENITQVPSTSIAAPDISSITDYKLCLDENKYYVYCSATAHPDSEETPFYKYIYIANEDADGNLLPSGAVRVVSKVVWLKRGYHEFDIQTIITDWRRI